MIPLTILEIDAQLMQLNRAHTPDNVWHHPRHDNALSKTFLFADFAAAFAFMTRIASVAEQLNHHPDWRNVWNRVEVRLSTHDAGGITTLDFRLAAAMDEAAASARQ